MSNSGLKILARLIKNMSFTEVNAIRTMGQLIEWLCSGGKVLSMHRRFTDNGYYLEIEVKTPAAQCGTQAATEAVGKPPAVQQSQLAITLPDSSAFILRAVEHGIEAHVASKVYDAVVA